MSKPIRDQLRVIESMLRTWDPIGVIANPDSRFDEYDAYAPAILRKLRDGTDAAVLAQHLHGLATREMGLLGDIWREWDVAQKLVIWWANECARDDAS